MAVSSVDNRTGVAARARGGDRKETARQAEMQTERMVRIDRKIKERQATAATDVETIEGGREQER